MGVVSKGGQYQVIIGSDVGRVHKEITNQAPSLNQGNSTKDENDDRSVVAKAIDTITGIFTPILPAITAAGMLKAVLSLLVVFNLVSNESQSYQIVNFMADAAFYFLPILLAVSSAKKFNTNAYLAMMVGGIYYTLTSLQWSMDLKVPMALASLGYQYLQLVTLHRLFQLSYQYGLCHL